MKEMKSLRYAFLGCTLGGCGIAILFAPAKGEETRKKIKDLLKKKGIDFTDDEVERLVDQISAQVEQ